MFYGAVWFAWLVGGLILILENLWILSKPEAKAILFVPLTGLILGLAFAVYGSWGFGMKIMANGPWGQALFLIVWILVPVAITAVAFALAFSKPRHR